MTIGRFKCPGLLRRLRKDDSGTAVMEFGLIAGPLTLLLMGMFEFLMVIFLGTALEQGVIEASRYAITGYTEGGVSREEKVRQILRDHTYGLADIKPEDITTLIYPSFDAIGKPEPYTDENSSGSYDAGEPFNDINGNGVWDADMGAAGLGGPGDVVVYKVNYTWGFLTRILEYATGDLTLTGGIAVRNEP